MRTLTMIPRLTLILCLLLPTALPVADVAVEDEAAVTRRVYRKMHLVRPDLLPYPVAFEYYC